MRVVKATWFVAPHEEAFRKYAEVIECLRNTGGCRPDEWERYPTTSLEDFVEAVNASIEARRREGYPCARVRLEEDVAMVVYTTTSGRDISLRLAGNGDVITFRAGPEGSEELYSWIVEILGSPDGAGSIAVEG